MSIVGKFLARIRRKRFAANITREIYQKIFPHINDHVDHGYPFSSHDELETVRLKGYLSRVRASNEIELAANKMPEAEANAFLYIVNRDLEEQMRMYLKYANARKYPDSALGPQFVATAA